jgi:hypothetical protein
MRTIIATAALAIAVSASLASAADEYKIKFSRPSKAGDTEMVSTTLEFKGVQKVDVGGQTKEDKTEFKADLEGTETIDAVNDKGSATKVSIKITKCTRDGSELIPAGSTLTAENVGGKTEFKVDGNDPSKEAVEALTEMVDTAKPDAPSDDELLGTDKPQKVGDSWPVHTDVMAKEFSDGPIQLTGDQLKGETKLTDVSTIDGKPCETMTTTLTADVPAKDPKNQANVHDLKLKADAVEVMPVDESLHTGTMKMTRAISFMMDAPGATVTISVDSTREDKYTDAKK